jgi:hypothetical protein
LRDLYLIVDTINRDNNDKKNKQGRYEQWNPKHYKEFL